MEDTQLHVRMSQDYDKNSHGQRSSALNSLPKIKEHVKAIIQNNSERFEKTHLPFTIADLGCADGHNSIPVLDSVICLIREAHPELPISIYLNDTPSNDFSSVVQKVSSGLGNHTHVSVYSIGKSFYESLFSDNSVDLMISSVAAHWIPTLPCPINYMGCLLMGKFAESPEGQIWEKEAEKYWERFLNLRYQELRLGGLLVVTVPAFSDIPTSEDLRRLEHSAHWKLCFFKALSKFNLECDKNYTLPAVLRSLKHYKKAFDEKKTKLQLIESFYTPPIESYPIDEQDPIGNVIKYTRFVRAISYEVLKNQMMKKGIEEEVAKKVLEEFYEKEMVEHFLKTELAEKAISHQYLGLMIQKK